MSMGLVLRLNREDGVIVTCPDGSTIRFVVTETSGGWARVAIHAPLSYRMRRKSRLAKEGDCDAVGDRLDGERVLSAAGMGGGMGLETGIETPEAVAKGENE